MFVLSISTQKLSYVFQVQGEASKNRQKRCILQGFQ